MRALDSLKVSSMAKVFLLLAKAVSQANSQGLLADEIANLTSSFVGVVEGMMPTDT